MNIQRKYQYSQLEKLLSKNYKWWYFLGYNIVLAQARVYGILVSQIANFLNTFITTYIWVFNNGSNQIITYLVLGSLYRSITQTFWNDRIGSEIVTGKITNLLLVPTGYIKYNFYANLGQRLFRNFSLVFTSLIVCLIFINFLEFNWDLNLILLLLFLPVSFSLNYFLNIMIGFSAFFINDARNYKTTSNAVMTILGILTGSYIPLDKLPYGLVNTVQLLPFAWLLHHPMQIYLGKYSNIEILYTFLGGIIWCIVLYLLAKLVFQLGLKRNESVGL